jgi:hypothetical protein
LSDCCFNFGYKGLKFRKSTPSYAKSSIAQSRNSALCSIAQSCDSAVCYIARSRNSALCYIARSLCFYVADPDDFLRDPDAYAVLDREPDPDAEPEVEPNLVPHPDLDVVPEPKPNPKPNPDVFKCRIQIWTFSKTFNNLN